MVRVLSLITIIILLTVGCGQQTQVNYTCGLPKETSSALRDPFWYETLPDGKIVAIMVETDLYKLVLYNGDSLKTLYESPKGNAIFSLTASPDGTKFVVVEAQPIIGAPSESVGELKLLSIDLAGQVTILRQGANDPLFSPDGKHLLYRRSLKDTLGLTVLNLATSEERFLAPELEINTEFVEWSPDGKQIVVNPYFSTIYLVSFETGSYEVFAEEGEAPAWSPDGTKIAFIRREAIVLKDVLGGNESIYTATPERLLYVQWINQDQLRFWSDKDGKSKQYLIRLTKGTFEQICQV